MTHIRLGGGSLTVLLIAGGVLWIALALGVAGVLLSTLFRDHVERSFELRLGVLLDALIVAADVTPDGTLGVALLPGEPRFARPFSGWYWQIIDGRRIDERSRSLWDQSLSLAPVGSGVSVRGIAGPETQSLRILERDITLPGLDRPLRFAVAADLNSMVAEIRPFTVTLSIALLLLGLGLIAALALQVRYGLKPLTSVRRALAAVRDGRAERLRGDFPNEVRPLAAELNAMLEHNDALLERARRHAGNLAHALKTPLTVLTNAAADDSAPLVETVRSQIATMRRDIEHHLAHARASGGERIGMRADVAPVLDGLKRTLDLLHAERAIDVAVEISGRPYFRGDRQDLEEMLGNLMDNGCKWARSRVRIEASATKDQLHVTIDDDGPGLSEERRAEALKRGRRLDEATPGDGLGLDIVYDLAQLYDGKLELGRSPLGGLRVLLTLPAAAQSATP